MTEEKTNTPPTVMAHLVCANAPAALEFYAKAFGAEPTFRLDAPDGKLMHACVRIGATPVFIADEFPDWNSLGPASRGGTTVTLHIHCASVGEADALYDRAIAAGATSIMPMADAFWGDRYGQLEDPFGHRWSLAAHVRDVPMDEMKEAIKSMPDCA